MDFWKVIYEYVEIFFFTTYLYTGRRHFYFVHTVQNSYSFCTYVKVCFVLANNYYAYMAYIIYIHTYRVIMKMKKRFYLKFFDVCLLQLRFSVLIHQIYIYIYIYTIYIYIT